MPISLTRIDMQAQLHNVLRGYKAGHLPEPVRAQHRLQVAALLLRFINGHRSCIASVVGEDWDTLTSVPSTSGRQGEHPLAQAIDLTPLRSEYVELLNRGTAPVGHNQAGDKVYNADPASSGGRRVLIIDDTFTTGARLQSAASALVLAGARVVAGLVLGRVVRPDYCDEADELWNRQSRIAFDFGICCLE